MEEFGVPKHIVGFVIPTGYSFNLDGSTLYLSLAAIFVAQAAGVHLSFGQQLVMMLTLMLTSKGVAGVPRAAMVILAGTLATFHCRWKASPSCWASTPSSTWRARSINVLGNCLASAVVARWEGYDVENDVVRSSGIAGNAGGVCQVIQPQVVAHPPADVVVRT
jgi:proton glutamate symport protein